MEIKATQRDVRQAPRKVRLVANTVKKLSLENAIRQLAVVRRAATLPVLKTLRQAVANAVHNHGLSPQDLRIKDLLVNDGPTLKRWRAVSRGRSHAIQKKTCHIAVILETIEKKTEKKTLPAAKSDEVEKSAKKTMTKPKPAAKVTKTATKATAKVKTTKTPSKKAAK